MTWNEGVIRNYFQQFPSFFIFESPINLLINLEISKKCIARKLNIDSKFFGGSFSMERQEEDADTTIKPLSSSQEG